VLDYESAVYALAIGWAADPQNTRPLDWSKLSEEKMTYDFLKSLCNIEMVKHMKETAIDFDPQHHTDLKVICALIKAWKPSGPAALDVFIVWENGCIVVPALCDGGEASKQIYIRPHDDRWEGSGYFQDPVPSTSSAQPTSTLSAISQIDIQPALDIGSPLNALIIESSLIAEIMSKEHIDTTAGPARSISKNLLTFIQRLHCWSEVCDLPSNLKTRLRLNISRLAETAMRLAEVICSVATDADKKAHILKWAEYVSHEVDRHSKYKHEVRNYLQQHDHEAVEQRVDGHSGDEEGEESAGEEDEESEEDEEDESEEEEDKGRR